MKSIYSISLLTLLAIIASCKSESVQQQENKDYTITTETFTTLNKQPGTIILDVRTPEELAEGQIPGAINIDFYSASFEEELKKLDTQKTIIAYCRSGGRSSKTCELLTSFGHEKVYNYGGFDRWLRENK